MDEPVSDQASAASDHPAIALPAVAGPPPTGTDGHRARWWLFVVCLLGLLVGAAWVWETSAEVVTVGCAIAVPGAAFCDADAAYVASRFDLLAFGSL